MTEADQDSSLTRPTGAAALAFVAFPLAYLCLDGVSMLNGRTYVFTFFSENVSDVEVSTAAITSAYVLSALFALAPLLLARAGLARVSAADAWWIRPLLRAALALAAVTVGLRLVTAALVAIGTNDFAQLIFG